jgi:hypothetical protein
VWGVLVPGQALDITATFLQALDITATFLTSNVLSTLGKVDNVASQVRKAELRDSEYGVWHKI